MRNYYYLVIVLSLLGAALLKGKARSEQLVVNPSFEEWAPDSLLGFHPTGWIVFPLYTIGVKRSTNKHTGVYQVIFAVGQWGILPVHLTSEHR